MVRRLNTCMKLIKLILRYEKHTGKAYAQQDNVTDFRKLDSLAVVTRILLKHSQAAEYLKCASNMIVEALVITNR